MSSRTGRREGEVSAGRRLGETPGRSNGCGVAFGGRQEPWGVATPRGTRTTDRGSSSNPPWVRKCIAAVVPMFGRPSMLHTFIATTRSQCGVRRNAISRGVFCAFSGRDPICKTYRTL